MSSDNINLETVPIGDLHDGHVGGLVRIDCGPALPNGSSAGRLQGRLETIAHSTNRDGNHEAELTIHLYDDDTRSVRVYFPASHPIAFPTAD